MITYTALAIILGTVWLLCNIVWAGIVIYDRFIDGADWVRGAFGSLAVCVILFVALVGANELLQWTLQQLIGVGSI